MIKRKITGIVGIILGVASTSVLEGFVRTGAIESLPAYIHPLSDMFIVSGAYLFGKSVAYDHYIKRYNSSIDMYAITNAQQNNLKKF